MEMEKYLQNKGTYLEKRLEAEGFISVIYINLKEINKELLIVVPKKDEERINNLILKLKRSSSNIPRAQDFIRNFFPKNGIDLMVILSSNDKKIEVKEDFGRKWMIFYTPIKKIINGNKNCIEQQDEAENFICKQLRWLSSEFKTLSLYAFSPVSLSETLDCLLFILGQNTVEPMKVRNYFLVNSLDILTIISEIRLVWALSYALCSAVAAIMARNMSHNIGSHVLARSETKDIIDRLKNFGIKIPKVNEPNPLNILKSRLDRYIKQKADFLAEISSEPLVTTKSLMFYKEVILPFVKNSQIMDTIAANEGIRYRDDFNNRLKIRVFINSNELSAKFSCMENKEHENNPPVYQYPKLNNKNVQEYPYSSTCNLGHELQLVDIENGDKDVEVALPGPLGEFSVYGFLENFIRNSAKHRREKLNSNENLQIFIQILEDEEKKEFYIIRIWDNITDPNEKRNVKIEEKERSSLLEVIDAYIKSSIIDDSGKLKRQAWGIAEMKINSLLLYGSTDFSRLSEMLTVRSLPRKDLPVKRGKSDNALVYEFRLMKSKFAYILTKNTKQIDDLIKLGIKVFNSIYDFKKELTEAESFSSPKFVILDGNGLNNEELNELEGIKQFMPFRVIIMNKDLKSLFPGGCVTEDKRILPIDAINIDNWKEKVWDIWIRHIIKLTYRSDKLDKLDKLDKKVCLHIYLEQECDEQPTKNWANFANGFNSKDYIVKIKVWGQKTKCTNSEGTEQFIHIGYDRHGKMKHLDGSLQLYRKVIIDKLSSDFVHLFTQNIKPNLPFELTEALLINVAVADDRLAEKSDEKIKINSEQELWLWGVDSKVYFVSHLKYKQKEIPVHPKVKEGLSAGSGKIKWVFDLDNSKLESQPSTPPIQMLIIHQGLIDELNLSKEEQEKLLLNIQKNVPFLIVDSGRGIPPTLSEKVKFLPYSLLEQYLIPRISKYCLINTCMSLTRRKEK